jgi:hypothetical protein
MAAAHTPGPFFAVEGGSTTKYVDDAFGLEGGRDYYLAELRHGDPDELEANANLFAASAELLTAARAAFKLLDSVAFVTKEGDTDKPLRLLRAAIAKATGAAT